MIYAHNTKIKKWDVCAGDALLRSTNGMTVDWSGKEIDYSYLKIISNGIVASKFDISVLRKALHVRFTARIFEIESALSLDFLICCLAIIYMCKRNRYRIRHFKSLC